MIFPAYLGCAFLGKSKNGFVISDHMDSSLTKKTEDLKKGSFTMTTACPRASCDDKNGGKNNKLMLAVKTRRNFKRHKLQQTILEQNTP